MPRTFLLRAVRACSTFATILLAAGSAGAFAGSLEAPLELLYNPGNQLVAGSLVEINPGGRLVFQRKEVLGGRARPPELIDVRAPKATLDAVKTGERYIFGYAFSRSDPRDPLRTVVDPEGPVLLTSIGLEPALFRDTREVRAILKAGRTERRRESRRFFDLLMQALAGPDRALQNLAAGELAQDREVREHLREGGQPVVERVVGDASTPSGVRSTLLLAAATRPGDFGGWWQDAALKIVETTPAGGYTPEASDPTGLVLVAFEALDRHAVRIPPDALKRWVSGDTPLLAERASLMLRRESPAMERSTIQQALADPKLPEQTRKFLSDHLRRLDRLDAGSKARKDGAG